MFDGAVGNRQGDNGDYWPGHGSDVPGYQNWLPGGGMPQIEDPSWPREGEFYGSDVPGDEVGELKKGSFDWGNLIPGGQKLLSSLQESDVEGKTCTVSYIKKHENFRSFEIRHETGVVKEFELIKGSYMVTFMDGSEYSPIDGKILLLEEPADGISNDLKSTDSKV